MDKQLEIELLKETTFVCGHSLSLFIDFLQNQNSGLTRSEATLLASAILQDLPQSILKNASLQDKIKEAANIIIAKRQILNNN